MSLQSFSGNWQRHIAHMQAGNTWLTDTKVITDPSDPKFDLEKLLLKVQKESP
jgi:F-type H+-transporting ATP synthase subunit e